MLPIPGNQVAPIAAAEHRQLNSALGEPRAIAITPS